MKPKSATIQQYSDGMEVRVPCFVHGFFQGSDGDISEPEAVIEEENGQIKTVPAYLVKFDEPPLGENPLKEALHDILERNHQMIQGSCPWCGAEDYLSEDEESYHCDHNDDCAVTMIEALLAGRYEFLNKPKVEAKP